MKKYQLLIKVLLGALKNTLMLNLGKELVEAWNLVEKDSA